MTKQETTGDLPRRKCRPEGAKQGPIADRHWPLALALAAALLVSACGSKDNEAAADTGSATAEISGPAAVAAAPAPESAAAMPPAGDAAAASAPPASAPPASAAPASAAPASAATPPAPAEAASTPAPTPTSTEPPALAVAVETDAPAVNEALLVTGTEEPALSPEMAAMIEAGDPEAGRRYAQRCVGCHSLREEQSVGGPQVGPVLFGIFEAPAGAQIGFDYSPALAGMHDAGLTWTAARLNAFLTEPSAALPGTTMSSGTIGSDGDRANVIAFLKSLQPAPQVEGIDPELLARLVGADLADGEALVAGRCGACHSFEAGGDTIVGPNLYDVVGRQVAAVEGFAYSPALRAVGAESANWTFDRLDAFLAGPAIAVPGTRMGFAGMADADDRAAVIAYLRTLSDNPLSFTGAPGGPLGIGVYQEGLTPVIFTNGQAVLGQSQFGTLGCDACHDGGLLGGVAGMGGVVPPLRGFRFEEHWFAGTVFALFDHMAQHAAQVSQEVRDNDLPMLMAYVLSRNGFQPGDHEFPLDRDALRQMGFYQ